MLLAYGYALKGASEVEQKIIENLCVINRINMNKLIVLNRKK